MEKKKYLLECDNKTITLEFSRLAEQTNGSVITKMGETVILANVVMSKEDKPEIDYFPLLVDYEEKYYAVGKIYGSRFVRRETRPSEIAILTGRLIDRVIRPLFPKNLRREVQLVITCLSIDEENDPDILGIIAASAALATSDIPWNGPIAGIRIGWAENTGFIINPSYKEREGLALDLIVGGTKEKINMLEAGAKEVPEEIILEAVQIAQKEISKLISAQEKIFSELLPKPKIDISTKEIDSQLIAEVKNFLKDKLETAFFVPDKKSRQNNLRDLEILLLNHFQEKNYQNELTEIKFIFHEEINALLENSILEKEKRPDNRHLEEIRPIEAIIDILPRTHGSALFVRGTTQALSVVTLGAPGDTLTLQGMEITGEKRFIHHYNFPAYSVGEIGPLRGPGRREIGHGALAEKALMSLIPPKETFPYTIRVVSEILSSNGSTSMASVCASSLALMAAGVPLKEPVAGIAMGLITGKSSAAEKEKYKILTDIQGPEDQYGKMDCKVAGTKNGITALQMDVKIEGITPEILKDILSQAKKARLEILEKMNAVISQPRKNLSPFAPRILTLHIKPEKIGEVIGPGGKIINQIISETGVTIDIEQNGDIFITANDENMAKAAIEKITEIVREFLEGDIVEGEISQIKDFGAIVKLGTHKEGLLHISELAPWHVEKVDDIIKSGEKVKLKIKRIEPNGKISLSLKDIKYSGSQEQRKPIRQARFVNKYPTSKSRLTRKPFKK